ncbi:hypothetical protein, partial [Leptospira noguchii]|uniref:hypothetical protein n=1 Tax=Leptospira noguchii TaxID=28182 RepID=UPI001E5669CD
NYYKLKFHNETFKNSGILFELVRKNRCSSSRKLSILMLFERIFYNAVPIRPDFIEVIQDKT